MQLQLTVINSSKLLLMVEYDLGLEIGNLQLSVILYTVLQYYQNWLECFLIHSFAYNPFPKRPKHRNNVNSDLLYLYIRIEQWNSQTVCDDSECEWSPAENLNFSSKIFIFSWISDRHLFQTLKTEIKWCIIFNSFRFLFLNFFPILLWFLFAANVRFPLVI